MNKAQGEDQWEEALAAWRREARSTRRRLAINVGGWVLALFLAVIGVGWLVSGRSEGLFPLSLSLLCILLIALTSLHSHSKALDALLSVADIRSVGPLLDLLNAFTGRRNEILAVLARLLPQLQDQDAGGLTTAHRAQLRTALALGDFWREREFLIGIVAAFQQIGDREDLTVVTGLAMGQSDSWQEQQVRDAARICLPHLRERVERQKQRDILLRPAFAAAPNELLHPVIGGSDPNPSQLLRPEEAMAPEIDSQG